MSLIEAGIRYITDICAACEGMKCLVMDTECLSSLSTLISSTFLIDHQVYSVHNLTDPIHDPQKHLSCVVISHPSPSSLQRIKAMLSQNLYKRFYLYFTAPISQPDMLALAESDFHEVVDHIQEVCIGFMH